MNAQFIQLPELMQLQLLTRFKLQLMRSMHTKVDTHQFVEDREYALQILQMANQSEDEDLLQISLLISGYLKALDTKVTPAVKKSYETQKLGMEADKNAHPVDTHRYLYGSRG